jgi:hypothetical protein
VLGGCSQEMSADLHTHDYSEEIRATISILGAPFEHPA